MPIKRRVVTRERIKSIRTKSKTDDDGMQGGGTDNTEKLTDKPEKKLPLPKQGRKIKSRSEVLRDINKSLMTGGRIKMIN